MLGNNRQALHVSANTKTAGSPSVRRRTKVRADLPKDLSPRRSAVVGHSQWIKDVRHLGKLLPTPGPSKLIGRKVPGLNRLQLKSSESPNVLVSNPRCRIQYH